MPLKIRAFELKDLKEVERLHELHFSDLVFPPFADCLNAFIIEDEKDEIVLACALEVVAEAMLVTNKDKSEIKIGKAFVEAQKYSHYTCKMRGIRDLYALVEHENYGKHLVQHGFKEPGFRVLKLEIL